MILLRSALFQLYFVLLTIILGIVSIGVRLSTSYTAMCLAKFWSKMIIRAVSWICNIQIKINGLENLPNQGPFLIASQHQSAFDTFIWMNLVKLPTYILKKELLRIPLVGPMLSKTGMIAVDRSAGVKSLHKLLRDARLALSQGRQLIIFPQGTRTNPGQQVRLKPGLVAIVTHYPVPIIPVATDSGRCWPKRGLLKYPGVIHIHIAPPLQMNLGKHDILDSLNQYWQRIEAKGYKNVPNN